MGEGFGAIDVHDPKAGKTKKNADEFLHSYVSLRSNFADRMRSIVVSYKKYSSGPQKVLSKRNYQNLVLSQHLSDPW